MQEALLMYPKDTLLNAIKTMDIGRALVVDAV